MRRAVFLVLLVMSLVFLCQSKSISKKKIHHKSHHKVHDKPSKKGKDFVVVS